MKWFKKLFKKNKCTCPQECDCQNPPPDNWDGNEGVFHVSEHCPVHNDNPRVMIGCPIHDL